MTNYFIVIILVDEVRVYPPQFTESSMESKKESLAAHPQNRACHPHYHLAISSHRFPLASLFQLLLKMVQDLSELISFVVLATLYPSV